MNTHKLAIIGGGQMGRGIAQVAIMKGISVWLYDNRSKSAQQAESFIQHQFQKGVDKGKWSQAETSVWLKSLHTTHQLSDLSSVDVVIEAATEDKTIKYELFSNLDRMLPPHALLLSNTSSISITELASKTQRPDKVAGMHFMNPVPVMKLVEGIAGLQTSLETMKTVQYLAEYLGKTFIQVQDAPGFVVNRILMPMINEAVYALSEGLASKEEIDQGMKLGTNCPMGPLELADFIGLDTCLSIMEVLYDGLGDSKYRPCPLLKKYVAAQWLGKKSGRGFYEYRSV
jgi:3-hydroxybutyryl-CoA dehydrogenase